MIHQSVSESSSNIDGYDTVGAYSLPIGELIEDKKP